MSYVHPPTSYPRWTTQFSSPQHRDISDPCHPVPIFSDPTSVIHIDIPYDFSSFINIRSVRVNDYQLPKCGPQRKVKHSLRRTVFKYSGDQYDQGF